MTLEGADKLHARLKAIGQTEMLLRDIQAQGVREAKLLVPRRTGNLGRTIRPGRVTADYAEIIAGGQREVGYAAAVERGTKPRDIRPRTKKALAWGGPRTLGGRLRVVKGVQASATNFATIVHHPGTKAQPYLAPGFQKAVRLAGLTTIVRLWDGAA
jgi:hypothetical protein